MSAEREDHSLLARPLQRATAFALRSPRLVIGGAVLLAICSLGISIQWMGFKTNRLDLLNPQSEYNRRWIAYLEEFGSEDDAIVVVRGGDPERVLACIDQVAARLELEDDHYHSVLHKVNQQPLRRKGLHYLSSSQLQKLNGYVRQMQPIYRGQWRRITPLNQVQEANLTLLQLQYSKPLSAGPQIDGVLTNLNLLLESVQGAMRQTAEYRSPWPSLSDDEKDSAAEHLLAADGRIGFVLTRLRGGEDSFTGGNESVDRLRDLLDEVAAAHPEVEIGLTGMPILENDEMRSSQSDTAFASTLSLLGVTLLFIAGFGGVRYPLMTVLALLLALAWSLGYITIAVGHLNILSVSFGVILIGLGIDFGIHYVARYLQIREEQVDVDEALRRTAGSVGPGIVTGGVTTSLAFCTAALTEFTGVAELGLIAGGGVLLCIVAALFVLPAIIKQADKNRDTSTTPRTLPLGSLSHPSLRYPVLMLGLVGLLTLATSLGFGRLHYDHNLLNLQPRRLASVVWERFILEESDRSVWFALSVANTPEELRMRKVRFDALPSVERTEEIVSLLPPADATNLQLIRNIHDSLGQLPSVPPVVPSIDGNVASRLDEQLQQLLKALPADSPQVEKCRQNILGLAEQLAAHSESFASERLFAHQQRMAADLLEQLRQLQDASEPEPPQLGDLPSSLITRYVGRTNKHLLKVYARGDIWNMQALREFVADVEGVDPRVTGHPIQTYYASRQMQQSYVYAAIYAFVAVSFILMLDFRNIESCLLAMLPMGLGMLQLFGILGLLNIPLNAANMIVLPLILGIGIDDGVHVIHDFRRQVGRYRLGDSTATAIVVTSATTMVGFGSMMFAKHQGLRSLGQVLTIGVFCCLCASVVVLPAVLSLISRRGQESAPEPAAEDAPKEVAERSWGAFWRS